MDANPGSSGAGGVITVGWSGLGAMGSAMAMNLHAHLQGSGAATGHYTPSLHVWNRCLGGDICLLYSTGTRGTMVDHGNSTTK